VGTEILLLLGPIIFGPEAQNQWHYKKEK